MVFLDLYIYHSISVMLCLVDIIRSIMLFFLRDLFLKTTVLLVPAYWITLYFFITALLSKLAVSSINLPTSSIARPWMSWFLVLHGALFSEKHNSTPFWRTISAWWTSAWWKDENVLYRLNKCKTAYSCYKGKIMFLSVLNHSACGHEMLLFSDASYIPLSQHNCHIRSRSVIILIAS